ncbi:ATP-dependent RNA helicase SUPV3L1/SUV3 [Roseibium hamelinense]|uniref:ATP-dependent RNA helicase SUPV3L1/SUV3 n=1 Tax=Roseibium hamelinense TaxID=150831 RepID=A0A562SKU2_9HYPH|nr:helicase-related protein [Roseibium hamelinense]MTI43476.1 helicase [Roseibium hamelinense]TWI81937.1 ATP-dependent RNA helicase SUPV3L1/SUV3 [Roseibium hamelinense]
MPTPQNLTLPRAARSRTVTAVLGPTNTGKTHLAIERMLAQPSGLIGLPLRLLAREVYGRIAERAGLDSVALITGEEKIIPKAPRYWVSTVEAMPLDLKTDFVAIDEVQLAGDLDRGHVFTDRVLNLRGQSETLLLGASTVRPLLEKLIPGLNVITRPRLSVLTYAGSKKVSRLPPRSAIVAFSADEVYGIAELIRRQRGGAAVVLGSLSPRTRNAQVDLFQNGDVEHLVATDAIGMGLNLDVDHIAFAGNRKYDGYQYRQLTPAEMGQIAGRAGRHTRDGTFGVTGRVDPLSDNLIEQIETHQFDTLKVLQWRNSILDFSTADGLRRSLDAVPKEDGLARAPTGDDVSALEHLLRDPAAKSAAKGEKAVKLLWDVCQVPDYRKIAPANHAEILNTIYLHLMQDGKIEDDWFTRQLAFADRTDGDIDTLANRISHIRTWTFVANRPDWLADPAHWQGVTRDIEDKLSDALHDRLTKRFVDRRTSVLMRRLRENAMLEAEITASGDVLVEGQHIGNLLGFRFAPDSQADGPEAKALKAAAQKALATEIESRADKLSRSDNSDFVLTTDASIRWRGEAVAKLIAGDDVLAPNVILLADEQLTGPARDKVQNRVSLWVNAHLDTLLKPLFDLKSAEGLEGLARGVAFQIAEGLGNLERQSIFEEVRQLDQDMRASLRKLGVRFGAYTIFIPALLKPAPSQLIAQLWALKNGNLDMDGLSELPQLSASGRTSIPVNPAIDPALYKTVGFRVCGPRAVRVDILERLADLIRPLIAWKPLDAEVAPPDGAIAKGGGFTVTVAMTSLLGCAGEDFSAVLKSLGYRVETQQVQRPVRPKTETGAADTEANTPSEDVPPTTATPSADNDTAANDNASETADAEEVAAPEANIGINANETVPPEAEQTDNTSEGVALPASGELVSEADSPTGTDTSSDAGEAVEMETVTIEIWRPGRSERRPRHNEGRKSDQRRSGGQSRSEKRGAGGNKHGKGQAGKPRGDRKAAEGHPKRSKPPQKDKPIDPNSPFAALMALKADMDNKGKK